MDTETSCLGAPRESGECFILRIFSALACTFTNTVHCTLHSTTVAFVYVQACYVISLLCSLHFGILPGLGLAFTWPRRSRRCRRQATWKTCRAPRCVAQALAALCSACCCCCFLFLFSLLGASLTSFLLFVVAVFFGSVALLMLS